ncbi:MAG: hypothetical protein ACRD3S_00220, partial [Terracidiphilus sp.]
MLAAKSVMYSVEYRRFYLRDLESIVVWPRRLWLLRPIISGVLLVGLGELFRYVPWMSFTLGGVIFTGLVPFALAAFAWVVWE